MEAKKKAGWHEHETMPKQSHDFHARFFNASSKNLCTLAQALEVLLVAMWQTTHLISALDCTELQDTSTAKEALRLTKNLLLYSTLLFLLVNWLARHMVQEVRKSVQTVHIPRLVAITHCNQWHWCQLLHWPHVAPFPPYIILEALLEHWASNYGMNLVYAGHMLIPKHMSYISFLIANIIP